MPSGAVELGLGGCVLDAFDVLRWCDFPFAVAADVGRGGTTSDEPVFDRVRE